ncbi:hypothetical protein SUDANB132_00210 [Streptomyces sp. enrichment culture]
MPLPPLPSALDPCKAVIDGILRAGRDAPRKQRDTITRISHRLIEEHGADEGCGSVRGTVTVTVPRTRPLEVISFGGYAWVIRDKLSHLAQPVPVLRGVRFAEHRYDPV